MNRSIVLVMPAGRDWLRGCWLLRDDRAAHGLRDPAVRPHASRNSRATRWREPGA